MFTETEAINAVAKFAELADRFEKQSEYFKGLDFSVLSGNFSEFTEALRLAQRIAQELAKVIHQQKDQNEEEPQN